MSDYSLFIHVKHLHTKKKYLLKRHYFYTNNCDNVSWFLIDYIYNIGVHINQKKTSLFQKIDQEQSCTLVDDI